IVNVSNPGAGADIFSGYEISLSPAGHLTLGAHRRDFERLRDIACEVPTNRWIALTVRRSGASLEVSVNGKALLQYSDSQHPLPTGHVGLRTWHQDARFRNFWCETGGERRELPFQPSEKEWTNGVSGMWRPLRRGSARGEFKLESEAPYAGAQSQ